MSSINIPDELARDAQRASLLSSERQPRLLEGAKCLQMSQVS